MTTKQEEIKKLEDTVTRVKRGTPEMEALLEIGYNMTVEEAQQIIREYDKNPLTHDYARVRDAKAMLSAFETDSIPVSPRKGWKRDKAVR